MSAPDVLAVLRRTSEEQRRRGVLHGDADTEAQDWAEFRSALARCGGAP